MAPTLTLSLPENELERLEALSQRLKLEPELAARFLLCAAVEALEPQAGFVWPIALERATVRE